MYAPILRLTVSHMRGHAMELLSFESEGGVEVGGHVVDGEDMGHLGDNC